MQAYYFQLYTLISKYCAFVKEKGVNIIKLKMGVLELFIVD
jgi:hypothetical protein